MGIAMYLSMSRLLGYGIVTVCILCIMDDHIVALYGAFTAESDEYTRIIRYTE